MNNLVLIWVTMSVIMTGLHVMILVHRKDETTKELTKRIVILFNGLIDMQKDSKIKALICIIVIAISWTVQTLLLPIVVIYKLLEKGIQNRKG